MTETSNLEDVLARGAAFRKAIGSTASEYDWLAKRDPDYENGRLNLAEQIYTPQDCALPIKYREMIAAVICACSRHPGVRHHASRAMAEGASVEELIEAFETTGFLVGFPTLHFALQHLIAITENRQGEV